MRVIEGRGEVALGTTPGVGGERMAGCQYASCKCAVGTCIFTDIQGVRQYSMPMLSRIRRAR